MYLSFYNLKKEPFQITPDPEFLFLSPSHKEALASIIYGVEQRKGFVSIIGEVGTGKTTIVRSYLDRADRKKIKPIYIFNSDISFLDLLKTILRELGEASVGETAYDMIGQLQAHLIEEYRKNVNIILIIDEAQNMPIETMESLRMLSNLETTKEKLLQIILVGQPELGDKLGLEQLRQLKQRLAIRTIIQPLTEQESLDYIHHRISRVATSPEPLFTSRALGLIVDEAGGAPRLLNILCDNALIAGYGMERKPVDHRVAKAVISDFRGPQEHRGWRLWKYGLAAGTIGASGVLIAAAYFFIPLTSPGHLVEMVMPGLTIPGLLEHPLQPAEIERSRDKTAPQTEEAVRPGPRPEARPDHRRGPSAAAEVQKPETVPAPPVVRERGPEPAPEPRQAKGEQRPTREIELATAPPDIQAGTEAPVPKPPPAAPASQFAVNAEGREPAWVQTGQSRQGPDARDRTTPPLVRVVQKGDWLLKLCTETYGFSNDKVVQWIKEHNPQIVDVNWIQEGDRILFPELKTSQLPPEGLQRYGSR